MFQAVAMKIFFRACFLSIVIGCFLSGCARHEADLNIVEITYAHPSSASIDPIIGHALDDFNKKHLNIHVRDLPIAGDYYSKLMVMIAGNTAPDVMWMGQSFGEFAQRGAFLDISHEMQPEVSSQKYFSKIIDWYRFDKKLYGFPYGIDCVLFFYNKGIFRKTGVPFPSNSWDLNQFLQTAQRLQKSNLAHTTPGFYAFGGQGIFPGTFDAHILSNDLSHSVINSNQYVQAMQFNADLINRYHVSPSSAAGISDKNQAFQLGNLAMMTAATWDIPIMQRDATKIDWDVVLPPRGVKRAIWGSSSGICVFSRTPHSQQSVALLKYLTSPKLQLRICHDSGCIPTDRTTAKQWADGITTPQHIQNFLKAIPYLEPAPRSVALSEITSKMSRASEKVMMGRATPRVALDEANAQINQVIERQNRLLGRDVER